MKYRTNIVFLYFFANIICLLYFYSCNCFRIWQISTIMHRSRDLTAAEKLRLI